MFKALIMYCWKKGFVQKDKLDKCTSSVLPGGRQREPMAWLTVLKSVSDAPGIRVQSQLGQSGTSLTFH